MKRLVISDFDDNGSKWCHSPHHKEVKTDFFAEKSLSANSKQESDNLPNFHIDNKLRRDKFYDFFRRATMNGEPRFHIDELNKNLTIKIDELPDSSKVSMIFEDLDSKSSLASRGKKNWSEQEIIFFIWLVMNYCFLNKLNYMDMDEKEWHRIAELFPGRCPEQCKLRWQSLLKLNLSKAPWTQEEDEVLVQVINDKGPKKWKEIAIELNKRLGNLKVFRQGKQCRERWINHLDPSINRGAWTNEEDIRLLEAHLLIGKRWAEIAKMLKNRTENSVKNRWNSLIKKYKNDFNFDSDTMSTSSNHSTSSGNDLERKISEVIINQKKKIMNENNSPETFSQGQMQEVPEEAEEDSGEYSNEPSEDMMNVKHEAHSSDYVEKKVEEVKEKPTEKKNYIKKSGKKGPFPVNVNKQFMDLVTQDMELRQDHRFPQENKEVGAPIFPQAGKTLQDNINFQNLMQSANLFMNNGPNFVPGLIQPPQDTMNNANALSLLNQMNSGNSLSSLANEMLNLNLNLWKASPPTFGGINNLFTQNLPQNDLASNILGMYTNSRPFQQQNTSNLPSFLSNSQPFLQDQLNNMSNSHESLQVKTEPKKQESPRMNTEEKEPNYLKYVEKPIDQLVLPERPTNSLQHAIVDTEGGFIYFLSPVSRDNLGLNKNAIGPNNNLTGLNLFGNSPALANRNWTSPTLNNGAIFSNSLNQIASMGLGRSSMSPNLGILHESPALFGQNFAERKSNECTPDPMNHTPLSILNNRSRVLNQMGGAPVNKNTGGAVFSKKLSGNDRSKNSSISTSESSKFDSPSSFLEAGQTRGLNFKSGDSSKAPSRQIM